ncbi:MarR family winged helix-turn-helix transcriptional regulator [Rhodosalinus sp.]|uniref:MarR family winged helix-turn-helix transcriptional regulator n=1 Tax=Rhodosalinus sp. TaxID=2047741 RepID=UPI00397D7D1A
MADGEMQEGALPRPGETLGEMGLYSFAPYLMNRIMGRYNADLQGDLRALGLTTAKMRTLAVLAVVPGLTINELSVYAVTEQSTMSRTLESLERARLVRREGRASDGRVREIYLTEAGRAEFDRAWPAMYAGYERMFEGIAGEERRAFTTTLQKILRNVRRHDI